MSLCKYCEFIDLRVTQDKFKWFPPLNVEHDLQSSHSMWLSAQNGCLGCRFFLDVLRREISDTTDMDNFLQREQRIWIKMPFSLSTHIKSDFKINISLDICLVRAEHDTRFIARHQGPKRPIPQDPSSEVCMAMAASWLAECASHEDCPPQGVVPLPTRLIEMTQEGQFCRLHLPDPGEKGHYVTLSHCWGHGVKFTLNKANFVQLQQAIHTEDLPRSFQDAITITRRLGFRFLWIDAICIIQDSEEDWAHQSSLMAGIYRNGSLMISALAASDSQHGILRSRSVLRSHHFGRNKEMVCQTILNNTSSTDGPLHGRGWCLQENIMAPRILHFGRFQLLWECVSKACAENWGLAGIDDGIGGFQVSTRRLAMPCIWPPRPGLEEKSHEPDFDSRLVAFYSCVEEFMRRKLTYRSDKLPALSGLASAFHTPVLGAYLAGLWEKDLVEGLNWAPLDGSDEDTHDSGEYIAPSFSWASKLGRCEFQIVREFEIWGPRLRLGPESLRSTLMPRLLSHRIELATSDPYGRISAASITLRGYTRLLLVRLDRCATYGASFDRYGRFDDRFRWMFGPPHEFLPPDHEYEKHASSPRVSDEIKHFIALPLRKTAHGTLRGSSGHMELSMLILEPVEGLEETYRRVGYVALNESEQMDPTWWEERTLTLI